MDTENWTARQAYFASLIGARVAVHSRGVKPDMKFAAVVSPGLDTTLLVSSTKRQRLAAPYGKLCRHSVS